MSKRGGEIELQNAASYERSEPESSNNSGSMHSLLSTYDECSVGRVNLKKDDLGSQGSSTPSRTVRRTSSIRFDDSGEGIDLLNLEAPLPQISELVQVPPSPEIYRVGFWPDNMWSWWCIDRCSQFVCSIMFTIGSFVGAVFSLFYFDRPVGWVLMSVFACFTGLCLIKKTLQRWCCP